MENKENLVVRIANKTGLKATQVKLVMDTLVSLVVDDLQNKRDININNLCKFSVSDLVDMRNIDSGVVKGQVKVKVSTGLVSAVNKNYGKMDANYAEIDKILAGLDIEE